MGGKISKPSSNSVEMQDFSSLTPKFKEPTPVRSTVHGLPKKPKEQRQLPNTFQTILNTRGSIALLAAVEAFNDGNLEYEQLLEISGINPLEIKPKVAVATTSLIIREPASTKQLTRKAQTSTEPRGIKWLWSYFGALLMSPMQSRATYLATARLGQQLLRPKRSAVTAGYSAIETKGSLALAAAVSDLRVGNNTHSELITRAGINGVEIKAEARAAFQGDGPLAVLLRSMGVEVMSPLRNHLVESQVDLILQNNGNNAKESTFDVLDWDKAFKSYTARAIGMIATFFGYLGIGLGVIYWIYKSVSGFFTGSSKTTDTSYLACVRGGIKRASNFGCVMGARLMYPFAKLEYKYTLFSASIKQMIYAGVSLGTASGSRLMKTYQV